MEEELEMTLKERAEQVRDEIETGANTAERVGGLLVDMCEAHEELKAEAERIARELVALAKLQSQDKAELAKLIEEKEAALKEDISTLAAKIVEEHDVTAELVESVRQALQDTIDANKNATDEALDAINTTIGEIQEKLEEHKATLDDHEERLTVVEGSVEAIREDADKAREDAEEAAQSAEQANDRLGEINIALENLSPDQQAALALSEKVEGNTAKLSELEEEVANIHPVTDEAGYHVVDGQGNIGMQYTEQGFGAAKVQPQFVEVLKQAGVATGSALDAVSAEVEETGFFFVDEQLNVGVKIDDDGIHAKNILEYEIIND